MAESAAIAPPPQPTAPPQPMAENATAPPSQPMAPPQPMAENATAAPPQPMAENATATVVVVVPPPPPDSTTTFLCLILAFFIPPLGVFIKYECEIEFWICLVLTFLAYAPGIIYAVWVIVKK